MSVRASRYRYAFQERVDQHAIEIVAAEMRVAVGCEHFEDAALDIEDGNIEGAAAEIEDRHAPFGFLIQAVSERGRGRLVDEAHDFESGEAAGIFGCLTLTVIEVGRDGNDDAFDLFAIERGFGAKLERAQDFSRNLWRRVGARTDLEAHDRPGNVGKGVTPAIFVGELATAAAHVALDRSDDST